MFVVVMVRGVARTAVTYGRDGATCQIVASSGYRSKAAVIRKLPRGECATLEWEIPRGASTVRQFSLELPASPYSFSGELITLVWAAELVVSPPGEVARVEFVMSPEGRDVRPCT